jgi:zinc/manganese transport system substrate-binding protein/zinc transport system substrate-binding protein/manganese/iron transport system substrate-binding protein
VKQFFTLLALAFTLIFLPVPLARAADPMPVVVTIPVLRDWVERIGGPHVRVTTLIKGLESEHSYSPRPSDLMAVRKAKLLVEVGVGLEIWVSGLIRSANNPALLLVTTGKGIPLLPDRTPSPAASPDHPPTGSAPTETSGHDHGSGSNPHVWLDPENAVTMIRHITDALSQTDPAHAAEFQLNQAVYLQELDRARKELLDQLRKLPDRRLIVHHPAWPYFAKRFDLEIVGEIQTQPGSEPSARQIQALVTLIRTHRIRVIVSEPQLNQKLPALLARETGVQVAILTPLPGALPGTDSYLDMLRYNVLQLLRAFDQPARSAR